MPPLNTLLPWLKAQVGFLIANVTDVAANRPEAARQAVICTLITVAACWVTIKIATGKGKK